MPKYCVSLYSIWPQLLERFFSKNCKIPVGTEQRRGRPPWHLRDSGLVPSIPVSLHDTSLGQKLPLIFFFGFQNINSNPMGISSPTTFFESIIYFIWKRLFQTRELCKKGKNLSNFKPTTPHDHLFCSYTAWRVQSIKTDIGKPINNSIIVDNHVFINIDWNGQSTKIDNNNFFRCQRYGFDRF